MPLIPHSHAERLAAQATKRRRLLAWLRMELWTPIDIAGDVMGVRDRRTIRTTLAAMARDGLVTLDSIEIPFGSLRLVGITMDGQSAAAGTERALITKAYERGRIGLTVLDHSIDLQRLKLGSWYSQTLKLLSPGDRVWVKIPKTGYVGVGQVTEAVRPIREFTVKTPTGDRPALEVLKHAEHYRLNADDPEKAEYFVRVAWLDTVPESRAVNEVGLFGNQNTVCQPTTPKWRHTVDRLKMRFPKWDQLIS